MKFMRTVLLGIRNRTQIKPVKSEIGPTVGQAVCMTLQLPL